MGAATSGQLLLFTLLWTTYSYFYQATGDNEACRLDELRALVADHTLKIDKYWWNTADVIHYPPQGGSVYPNKAPGTTLLLAPAYAVVVALLSPLRGLGVAGMALLAPAHLFPDDFHDQLLLRDCWSVDVSSPGATDGEPKRFSDSGDCHLARNVGFPLRDSFLLAMRWRRRWLSSPFTFFFSCAKATGSYVLKS